MKRVSVPWGVVVLGLVALSGCGGGPHTTAEPNIEMASEEDMVEFEAAGPMPTGYLLGVGDVFEANFLFEPTLNTTVTVRPDGKVALPIVGDVVVAGQAPAELDSLLTDAYAYYFQQPEVTINVVEFASAVVYVFGEVRNPRAVDLAPGMTALQAIATVGGPVPGSNMDSVILMRRREGNRATAQRMDLAGFMVGRPDSWDMLLAPHDIIYVPPTFITQVNRFVDQFFTKMIPIPVLYLRTWEMFNAPFLFRGISGSGL